MHQQWGLNFLFFFYKHLETLKWLFLLCPPVAGDGTVLPAMCSARASATGGLAWLQLPSSPSRLLGCCYSVEKHHNTNLPSIHDRAAVPGSRTSLHSQSPNTSPAHPSGLVPRKAQENPTCPWPQAGLLLLHPAPASQCLALC